MAVPEFVIRMGGTPDEWIERDDRLNAENENLGFNERNQLDWWIQNRKIRVFLTELAKLVEGKIRRGESPSKRLISWSYIARELKCDRATLKHPRRYQWVRARQTQLLSLIEESASRRAELQAVSEPGISDIDRLNMQLATQRTQTARWYDKCVNLEHQVAQLRRLLAIRNAKIKGIESLGSDHIQQI